MPNRLRVIAGVDGYFYSGSRARQHLEKELRDMGIDYTLAMPRGLNNWQKIRWMYDLIPREKFLLIVREPRKTSVNRSRYIKASKYFGTGKYKKGALKQALANEAPKPAPNMDALLRGYRAQVAAQHAIQFGLQAPGRVGGIAYNGVQANPDNIIG